VQGNIRVTERLDLLEGSRVSGDVQAQVLSVAAGAKVNGHVSMDGASAPETVAHAMKGKKAREEVEA
jgi:cytoskeletal protein CcmA (bactofilin family)